MQGNWISGVEKENKLTNNVAAQFPVQQRLYNFENLMSSYGFSKMVGIMFGKDIKKMLLLFYYHYFCECEKRTHSHNKLIALVQTVLRILRKPRCGRYRKRWIPIVLELFCKEKRSLC